MATAERYQCDAPPPAAAARATPRRATHHRRIGCVANIAEQIAPVMRMIAPTNAATLASPSRLSGHHRAHASPKLNKLTEAPAKKPATIRSGAPSARRLWASCSFIGFMARFCTLRQWRDGIGIVGKKEREPASR